MKKLIIQIPCYNEQETLPVTLRELPSEVEGFDTVEWLVIDDGSSDLTVEVARELGVHHIVSLPQNQGLAKAFLAGIEASCRAGADVIVNTDADNQYYAGDIPTITNPILDGKADMVIGSRPIGTIDDFSPLKKKLQKLGSSVVRLSSASGVEDAPSGFRAISRKAAMRLNVFNDYTYTLETIIQAGLSGFRIQSVPVRTNSKIRESKLVRSIGDYIYKSIKTIASISMIYRPVKVFTLMGCIPFTLGFILGLRWLIFFSSEKASSIPSLIFASILLLSGFQLWIFAMIAHLMAVNRRILEEVQFELRKANWTESCLDSRKQK